MTLFFNASLTATGPRVSTLATVIDKNEIFALDLPPYISTQDAHGGLLNEILKAAFNEAKMEVYITIVPLQSMMKYYYTQENAPGFMGRHLGLASETKSSLVSVPLLSASENYFYYKPSHPKGLEFKGKLANLKGLTYGAAKGEDVALYKNAGVKVKKSRTLSFFKKLKNGTIDFIKIPEESARWFLENRFPKDKDNFVTMREGSANIDLSVYFNMNNPKGKKMLGAFKKGLKNIVENGKYAAILEKSLKKDEILLQVERVKKYIK